MENAAIITIWAYGRYSKGLVKKLERQVSDPKTLEKPVMIAIWFVKEEPPSEPSMMVVALMLQSILEIPSPPCLLWFYIRIGSFAILQV